MRAKWWTEDKERPLSERCSVDKPRYLSSADHGPDNRKTASSVLRSVCFPAAVNSWSSYQVKGSYF